MLARGRKQQQMHFHKKCWWLDSNPVPLVQQPQKLSIVVSMQKKDLFAYLSYIFQTLWTRNPQPLVYLLMRVRLRLMFAELEPYLTQNICNLAIWRYCCHWSPLEDSYLDALLLRPSLVRLLFSLFAWQHLKLFDKVAHSISIFLRSVLRFDPLLFSRPLFVRENLCQSLWLLKW